MKTKPAKNCTKFQELQTVDGGRWPSFLHYKLVYGRHCKGGKTKKQPPAKLIILVDLSNRKTTILNAFFY